ncbi:MAG: class I SAM-dependent methyltransferase, partial [Campylobacteraceae bacterium]|nr:class I SAM-dependent methyltransferase [Campylobacteraceae bacterium]
MTPTKDYFEHKAKSYEKEATRVDNVKNIADTILKNISYDKEMELMDFGSGTGLLTSHIAPFVKKITAIDLSKAMNAV